MSQMDIERRQLDPEIPLLGPDAFESMRRAGRLAAETLDFITPHAVPGVTTEELDRLSHDFIVVHGAVPAPLHYKGFPKSVRSEDSWVGKECVMPCNDRWWQHHQKK